MSLRKKRDWLILKVWEKNKEKTDKFIDVTNGVTRNKNR